MSITENPEIQPVTMLYNIQRESVDARQISQYLTWAKELIKIFPNIIIFHNSSVDVSQIDLPDINFIRVEMDELSISQRKIEIEEICKKYLLAGKEDLVYKLPDYGIVVSSKFELLDKAHALTNASYYLWVDIGITRFLEIDEISNRKPIEVRELTRAIYFEVDLRRNLIASQFLLRRGLLRVPKVGSSRRVVGTGSFLVRRDYVKPLNILVKSLLDDWINKSIWDTEQVAIGHLIRQIPSLGFHIKKRNSPTSFLQRIFASGYIRAKSIIWMKILLGGRYKQ